jgi:hypothetical protein
LPDALKRGETAVAGEVSVPIATDETFALGDLQQPRRPISGRSLAATQERRSAGFGRQKATALERLRNSVVARRTRLLDRHDAAVGGEVAPGRLAIPTGTCGIENAAPPGEAQVAVEAAPPCCAGEDMASSKRRDALKQKSRA